MPEDDEQEPAVTDGAARKAVDAIGKAAAGAGGAAKDAGTHVVTGAATVADKVGGAAKTTVGKVGDVARTAGDKAVDLAKDLGSPGTIEAIGDVASSAIDVASSAIDALTDGIDL